MHSSTNKTRLTLIVVVAGMLVGYVTLSYIPQQRAFARRAAEIEAVQSESSQSVSLAAAIRDTQRELDESRAYNAAWQRHLPASTETSRVFGEITNSANQAGVTIVSFKPEGVVAGKVVRKTPVLLSLEGPFNKLVDFLGRVESSAPLIWIDELRMQSTEEDGKDLKCELKLAIFGSQNEISD